MQNFLKSAIALSTTFFAISAGAHFQIGVYEGKLLSGDACKVNIQSVSFESNVKHPLNERVTMQVDFNNGTEVIETRHLANVDAVEGTVRPKHGVLSAVLPIAGGAKAYELVMNEQGPTQMIYLLDNYRNPDANERKTCTELKYLGQ